jgi:hypothetical protein
MGENAMSGPWEKFAATPAPEAGPWSQFSKPFQREVVESGGVLPISRYNDGTWGFDSNAGIIGSIKRAVTLPGDVYTGKVDPMSEEGRSRAMDLAGLASPVNPAVRAGDRAIPGIAKAMEKRKPIPPTQEQLLAAGGKQIDDALKSGVDYSSASVANAALKVRRELEEKGFRPKQAEQTFGLLDELANPPPQSVANIADLESARRNASLIRKDNIGKTEGAAASRVLKAIDEFVMAPDPASVVSGPASSVGKLLQEGRANYAAGKRSAVTDAITERASRRAGASNSGQNVDNSIRGRVASALERPSTIGGFDDAERAALEEVATGTPVRNVSRYVGNLLGGGGGLGQAVVSGMGATVGGATMGPAGVAAGVALPAVGAGARQVANALTDRALRNVGAQTRARSPLYEQMLAETPMTPVSPEQRALLIRALMQATGGQAPASVGVRQEY